MKKLILILSVSTLMFAQTITLGVVPQQSPLKLAKKWSKVTKYLKEKTAYDIVFKTEKSIPTFEKKLYSGEYDIAYMNPYHFIVANQKQNYEAFTRANKNIVGILLAKEKSIPFTKENLQGKTFLFPAPNAFAATLLTKFELKNQFNFDIDKEAKVLYVNSHDSVYKGISRDIGYIGGGIIRTFNNFIDKNDKDKLNIIYKTNEYPSHPIAFHPRLNKDIVKKIKDAFLSMPKDLTKTLSIKKFIKTSSDEYEIIKSVKSL